MLILVSNDDGVYSKGIKALAQALKKIADVVVVAPDRERSATSHSLTLHRPLRVTKISPKVYAVDGTPTDCITIGIYEILKQKMRVFHFFLEFRTAFFSDRTQNADRAFEFSRGDFFVVDLMFFE